MKRLKIVFGLVTTLLLIFYLACVHYTGIHQVAIVWDRVAGQTTLDSVPGFNITAPWVKVARIDTRPQRVCIQSAGRSFNCKLVRFEPKAWRSFVAIEGVRYYWLGNRISFNWGYGEEYRGMKDLLRGYAFSSNTHPFISVIQEYGDIHIP